jgi:hypothetical protein
MPSPELRAPVDVIRREAELACDASSLRAVAGEIGMSPMGLRAFILGDNKPQDRTVRKLNAWHARRVAARQSEGEDEARSALIVLAGFFPSADRPRVLRNLIGQMEREFRDSGMAPPLWLSTLAEELRTSADDARGRG